MKLNGRSFDLGVGAVPAALTSLEGVSFLLLVMPLVLPGVANVKLDPPHLDRLK